MKKTLVLSLVLVFALSSAAFAGISFSGEFESELDYSSTDGNWTFENTLTLEVNAEGEGMGWAFEGELAAPSTDGEDDGAFALGEYKLSLEDDYFSAWIWGNDAETSDKGSNLGFIKAPKAADQAIRVEVPVMDVTTVTADYRRAGDAHDAVRLFADFDINDINLGLAAGRYYGAENNDTIVASAGTTIDMFTVKGAAGVTLGEDLGYAFGVDAKADATDEITVGAKFWASNGEFAGDVDADSSHVSAYAVFNDGTIWARPSVKFEGTFDEFEFTSNEQRLQFGYRFDDSIDLTDGDAWDDDWMEVTALAIRGEVKRASDVDTVLSGNVGAALPVFDGFLWAKLVVGGQLKADDALFYDDAEDVSDRDLFAGYLYSYNRELYADLDAYVAVNERLSIEPHIGYRNIANGAAAAGDPADGFVFGVTDGNSVVTELGATYLVGSVDGPELILSLANTAFFGVKNADGDTVDTDMVQTASLSVKVTF